jgi:pimeloyl-ACP methyl ester carboxylesterase
MNRALLAICGSALLINAMNAFGAEPVSYHTARVGELDIFYREAGPKDGPTVLLLHGFPSSSRMYQPLLESTLSARYHLIAPDYPSFGHSSWPDRQSFHYTFDHLAQVMRDFVDQQGLKRYTLFVQDYGGPVGLRMAIEHPERVEAIIVQNAVSHEEGLSELWAVRRAFWQDRPPHEADLRRSFLSLEATRLRHVGASPHPERINPDTWFDEFYFLNQPGQADIQTDLFFDYQVNVRSYPVWQKWLRDRQPRLLVLWGRFDRSFTVAGAEAYRREVPGAEIHVLDAGHFALNEQPAEIIRLTENFLDRPRTE